MKTNPTKTNQMNRADFLRSLGLSSSALMAFYCMGTGLTACGGSGGTDDPTPNPTGDGFTGNADGSTGVINFTLDLTNTNYSKLKTIGQYVIVGSVLVAKAKSGSIIALEKTCTHESNALVYRANEDDIYCATHGSEYNLKGVVEVGPATRSLNAYTTSLSSDGNTLTVTE